VIDEPRFVCGKVRLIVSVKTLPPIALPSSTTVWVPLPGAALSVIVSVAFLAAVAVSGEGVNVRGIVQLWPGSRLNWQPLLDPELVKLKIFGPRTKSFAFVPVILKSEKKTKSVPVFVTMTFKTRLCVLVTWLPNTSGVGGLGLSEICGAVAVPLRFTRSVCGPPPPTV
jgi:hypothetical protein